MRVIGVHGCLQQLRKDLLESRYGDAILLRTPAKVNLYLEVLGKRADGYHDLETLMVAVTLYE